jgi:hypothetical protein
MGGTVVLYVALAPMYMSRLMLNTPVHTLTVAGHGKPAIASACLASLDIISATATKE